MSITTRRNVTVRISSTARRLLTARIAAVALYAAALPFPWQPGGTPAALESGNVLVLVPLVAACVLAYVRFRRPLSRRAYALSGVPGILLSLVALVVWAIQDLFGGVETGAANAAAVAVFGTVLLSVIELGGGRSRQRRATAAGGHGGGAGPESRPEPAASDPAAAGATGGAPHSDASHEADELLLIIHGTGSAAAAEVGDRWWQAGSSLATTLEHHLPPEIRTHRAGEVFRWSGANLESHRRAAGGALAAHIARLSGAFRRLHIVGHSHGGSVAWHALRQLYRERALDTIGSVVTLGTPFLRLRGGRGLPWLLFAAAVLSGVLIVALPRIRDGLEAGPAAWLTPLGLAVLLVAAGFAVVLLALGVTFAQSVAWALRSQREREQDEEIVAALRGRLHCVWSPNDEAINGLRAALMVRGGLLISDAAADDVSTSFWRAPLQTLYDDIFGPILDLAVWHRTSRRLQGIDIGGAALSDVSVHPVPGAPAPPLPSGFSTRIDDWVAEHSSAALRRAREVLGVFWATGTSVRHLSNALGGHLSGRELVHWAYYQAPGMAEHVATLVAGRAPAGAQPVASEAAAPALRPPRRATAKAVLSLATMAALAVTASWSLLANWHRNHVYPLTGRAAVAGALAQPPLDSALHEGAYTELSAWFRALEANDPGTAMAETEADWPLQQWLSGRRRRMLIGRDHRAGLDEACAIILRGLTDAGVRDARELLDMRGRDGAAIRMALGAHFRRSSRNPELAERVVAPITDELLERLRRHRTDFARSCMNYDPGAMFYLPVPLRPVEQFRDLFQTGRIATDAEVAPAVEIARAWAMDSSLIAELRDYHAAPSSGVFGLQPRADQWALSDLAALFLTEGSAASRAEAGRVISELVAAEASVGLLHAVCRAQDPSTLGRIADDLPDPQAEQLRWAIWRCSAEGTGPQPPPTHAGDLYDVEYRLLQAMASGAPVDNAFLAGLENALRWREASPLRASRLRCDAAVLLAGGGRLGDALAHGERCELAADRLRVRTAIVHSYARRHGGVDLEAIAAEAARLRPPL